MITQKSEFFALCSNNNSYHNSQFSILNSQLNQTLANMKKSELRKEIKNRKRQFTSQQLSELSFAVIMRLLAHQRLKDARTVMLYYSLPDEVYTHTLVDALLAAGIEPYVTLYHWDLPLWQYKKGGWLKKDIIDDFAFYVKAVVEALSDRVTYWITFNEPSCFLMNGYMQGVHAPFKHRYLALPKFTKIFMLTNRRAVETIRKYAKKKPLIGLSFASGAFIPNDESDPKSVEEAYNKSFNVTMGTMNNRWRMDPILLGKPVTAYGIYATHKKDMPRFKADFDFLAVNHYEAFNYSAWGGDKSIDKSKLNTTSLGWVIDGRSIYWKLKVLYRRYRHGKQRQHNGRRSQGRCAHRLYQRLPFKCQKSHR